MATLPCERARLEDAYAQLKRQWETSASLWSDDAKRRFESEVWADYEPCVKRGLERLDALVELLDHARRDISRSTG